MLLLFSIQDPLRDTLYALQSLQGVIAGLAGYILLFNINAGSIYSRWWFDALFNFRKRNIYQLKGWTWLALAILLALLTVFIGTGPEGSGVKVNIQLAGIIFPHKPYKHNCIFWVITFCAFYAGEQPAASLSDRRSEAPCPAT